MTALLSWQVAEAKALELRTAEGSPLPSGSLALFQRRPRHRRIPAIMRRQRAAPCPSP